MLKVVIAKFLIENGWDILTGCINVGSNLAGAITSDPKGLTSKSNVLDQYAKEIQETNTIGNLGMIIQWFLPSLFKKILRCLFTGCCYHASYTSIRNHSRSDYWKKYGYNV